MVGTLEPERRSSSKDRCSGIERTRTRLVRGGERKAEGEPSVDDAEPQKQSRGQFAKARALSGRPSPKEQGQIEEQEAACGGGKAGRSQTHAGLVEKVQSRIPAQDFDQEDAQFLRYFATMAKHIMKLFSVYWSKPEKETIEAFLCQISVGDVDLSDDASRDRIIRAIRSGRFNVASAKVLFNRTMNRIRVTIQEVKRAGVPLRKDFALSVLFQAYQDVRPAGEAVVQSDGDQNLALADCDYHIAGGALEVVDRALQVRAEKILADIERQICEIEQDSALPAPASGLHINEAQFDLVIWEKADTPVKVEYEAGLVSEVRLHVKHNDEQRDINLKFTKGKTGEDGYLLIFTDKAKIWEVTVLIKWECYQEKVPRDEEKHL